MRHMRRATWRKWEANSGLTRLLQTELFSATLVEQARAR